MLERFILAIKTFFAVLSGEVPSLEKGLADASTTDAVTASETDFKEHRGAVQLLGALQREGRLVDFLKEDLGGASDAQIGVAARVVHDGCRKVLNSYFELVEAFPGTEGEIVSVEPGFDGEVVDIIGTQGKEPPFKGTLNHKGWRIKSMNMPRTTRGFSETLIQRAEIEL